MGTIESFVHLFRGRGDALGTWGGGCVRTKVTPEHFQRHLYAHEPAEWIGVYNVLGDKCSWGCVDIDESDLPLALNVKASLRVADIPAWIEQTTRGFHIWVFPADLLVSAATMRYALTAACLAVEYRPKEIFPKQTTVSGESLGNYVRLPLNGALSNPAPRDARRFIEVGVTLEDMDRNRAATPALAEAAALAPRPQRVDISVDIEAGLDAESAVREIGGLAYWLWRDGPAFDHDRSSTLARLAHQLVAHDVSADQAYAIVASADQRWGKFSNRSDAGVAELTKIVSNAYGGST